MAQYDNAIALARRLLAKFGETSTVRRQAPGTPPDASKPWEAGTATFTEYEVSAAWLFPEVERFDGSLVEAGDQIVYVEPFAVTPSPSTDHVVRVSGERWTILSVRTLNPNGQVVLHTLHVRR